MKKKTQDYMDEYA